MKNVTRMNMGGSDREESMTKSEALEKAIQKWDSIADGIGIDCGPQNCALCELYLIDKLSPCKGCPVNAVTRWGCFPSPYGRWQKHQSESHMDSEFLMPFCKECREIAREEADFLRGLREE